MVGFKLNFLFSICFAWNFLENSTGGVHGSFVGVPKIQTNPYEYSWQNMMSNGNVETGTILPPDAYEKIRTGQVAIVPNFLSNEEVRVLRNDARDLHSSGYFSTDALSSYGSTGKFDPSKDRAVLRLNKWMDLELGRWEVRRQFGKKMGELRADLARQLNRPHLDIGHAVSGYGFGSTEISYTRFGPGAFLKRHIDEHHEELKRKDGWKKPTRRSVTWLIYLNEDWDTERHGGELRVFERKSKPSNNIGATGQGDLQIGWLRATSDDPVERPVFLDGHCTSNDTNGGNCAMYIENPLNHENIQYITKSFFASPILFVAGSEKLTRQLLIGDPAFARRFHFLEIPKSAIDAIIKGNINEDGRGSEPIFDENPRLISPNGGTLVVFDSVSVPHEVLATRTRERWAASGWYHEDQQDVPIHAIS